MNNSLYYEDLDIGQRWSAGPVAFTADSIRDFAEEYDPQPFHLDDGAGARHFDGLIASGWHTAAACMRALVDDVLLEIAIIAALGIDDLRWRAPVRPGDELDVTVEIVEKQPWDDDRGRITFLLEATNSAGTLVHTRKDLVLVERA